MGDKYQEIPIRNGGGDSTLWQRTDNDTDFNELHKNRQIIDALQSRLEHLERINMDLEYRLEDQAKQCIAAERECKTTEKLCNIKCNNFFFLIN
jgi:hypothetical protein